MKQGILPFCEDTDPPPKWKVCRRCKKLLAIASFQALGARHHSYCRRCVVARTIELRLARRGRVGKFHPRVWKSKKKK